MSNGTNGQLLDEPGEGEQAGSFFPACGTFRLQLSVTVVHFLDVCFGDILSFMRPIVNLEINARMFSQTNQAFVRRRYSSAVRVSDWYVPFGCPSWCTRATFSSLGRLIVKGVHSLTRLMPSQVLQCRNSQFMSLASEPPCQTCYLLQYRSTKENFLLFYSSNSIGLHG